MRTSRNTDSRKNARNQSGKRNKNRTGNTSNRKKTSKNSRVSNNRTSNNNSNNRNNNDRNNSSNNSNNRNNSDRNTNTRNRVGGGLAVKSAGRARTISSARVMGTAKNAGFRENNSNIRNAGAVNMRGNNRNSGRTGYSGSGYTGGAGNQGEDSRTSSASNAKNSGKKRIFVRYMQEKLAMTGIIILLLAVAVTWRLYSIITKNEDKYTQIVLAQQSYDSRVIPYRRGDIVDRNGTYLATTETVSYTHLTLPTN